MDVNELNEEQLLEKFKQLTSGGLGAALLRNDQAIVEGRDPEEINDGYQLRFIGKDYAKLQAGLATETVVVPDTEHNMARANQKSGNYLIIGDNLDALKHLENSYSDSVKVIYVDPPYNTGSDGFVYNDNFNYSSEDLKLKLGLSDSEVERVRSLNGRSSHSAWLTFMYPRLLLAKRLLQDDGIIFISIDDNEMAQLKLVMDEIFGEVNFVGNIDWESKTKSQNTETAFNKLQPKVEHILVYTKKDHRRFNLIKRGEKDYPETDERGSYREYPIEVMNAESSRGRESMIFEVEGIKPPKGKQWQLGINTVNYYKKAGDLFVRDGKIIIKMRPENEKTDLTDPFWGFFPKEIGTAESAKKELTKILGGSHGFDTVKPVELIKRIIFHASGKDDTILDFFAGSGTTGEAVMRLNADDGGNRKFILVQLPELTYKVSDGQLVPLESNGAKVAFGAGYKSIDEITRKRLVCAARQIHSDYKSLNDAFDNGFKCFTLATPKVDTLDRVDSYDPRILLSDDMVTPFSSEELGVGGNTSGTRTLLTTWLIDDGYKFNDDYVKLDFAGAVAYKAGGRLYIIEEGWGAKSTKELLNKLGNNELSINTLIIYPYSFDFVSLNELKVNIKTNLDDEHRVELIERF